MLTCCHRSGGKSRLADGARDHHPAIGRRQHHVGRGVDDALGVTEEKEKERGKRGKDDAERRAHEERGDQRERKGAADERPACGIDTHGVRCVGTRARWDAKVRDRRPKKKPGSIFRCFVAKN